MKKLVFFIVLVFTINLQGQFKILFDATKAETASNADWIIDADEHNVRYSNGNISFTGNEANPQRFPTPDQSTVTANTPEDYWTGGISAWGIESVKQGWEVETLPIGQQITYGDSQNEQDLSNYDVFVVCEPNQLFTDNEKTAILNFIFDGGNLFLISDHNQSDRDGDGNDSVDVWNDFLENNSTGGNPLGIHMNFESFTEASTTIANLPGNPILEGPFGDITRIEFYAGTSFNLNHLENQSVTALVFRNGYNNDFSKVMIASAVYGNGKVLAVGDSSIVDDGTGDIHDNLYDGWLADANGNHRRLIMNAMEWMYESQTNSSLNITPFTDFEIFTTPGYIHIKNNSKEHHFVNINFYDLCGRNIFSLPIYKNEMEIPFEYKGILIYKILDENGFLNSGKIFMQ